MNTKTVAPINLVQLNKNNNITISHRVIAERTGNQEVSVRKLIDNHKTRFEGFGVLSFEMTKPHSKGSKGGRPQETYKMNEQQAYFLMTLLKNTDVVLDFKQQLVSAFFEMKQWIEQRAEARLEYRPMTDAIKNAHDPIKSYHFSNEANMINRIVLGTTAKQFKEDHNIPDDKGIRDYATPNQLKALGELQQINSSLIKLDMPYDTRKQQLETYFNNTLVLRLAS